MIGSVNLTDIAIVAVLVIAVTVVLRPRRTTVRLGDRVRIVSDGAFTGEIGKVVAIEDDPYVNDDPEDDWHLPYTVQLEDLAVPFGPDELMVIGRWRR